MADWIVLNRVRRRLRRERVFRDRNHPLDRYNDEELYKKFRFTRLHILQLTDEIAAAVELSNRRGALSPVLQVLLALRFYATGSFHDVCGELIGVHQTTASRTIRRVTQAILRTLPQKIRLPNAEESQLTKEKFFQRHHIPNVLGCIDGTQIPIQSPGTARNEHEYVNRKGYHSINVQVICDADLIFFNIVAKWPGSVHDARILRESPFYDAMESNQPPLRGHLLGDSGYMLRDWLMTPVLNPDTPEERIYNELHRQARCTVERSIGVAKRRWHCLRTGLRVSPERASEIIVVCFILHNRARFLALPDPDDEEDDTDDNGADENHGADENLVERRYNMQAQERARVAAGKVARNRLIAFLAHQ
ncbi:putative nuclease HARBI1 [Pomacea canaliculata]|uniref:putative nuclease HARBI1 n=1 Tax=Pomacea canaliculata TaxID=400727 RepID=UPI000D72E3B7|nr:putative nuclease HARBI1 [Pomacea canaliculata]